jgi:hypothetical protein
LNGDGIGPPTVTILDNLCDPVANAAFTGTLSANFNGVLSDNTHATGTAAETQEAHHA